MKLKSKVFTALSVALLILPTSSLASSEYFESNKKSVNFTNKKAEDQFKEEVKTVIGETDGKTYDKFSLGLRGGELDLIFESVNNIKVGNSLGTSDQLKYQVSISDKMIVSDLRATGEGWNLTVSASPLTSYVGNEVFNRLPSGTFTMSGKPTVTAVGTTNVGIPNTDFYGRDNEVAIDDGEVVIVSAYFSEGMGNWKVDSTSLKFFINMDRENLINENEEEKPTPYKTKITWSLTSGPGL